MMINFYLPLILSVVIGLLIGSFLNVIIVRLPIMLEQRWRQECQDFLGLTIQSPKYKYNLSIPRSHCPHCQTTLKIRHNIPVISYLILRARCATCKKRISLQYPCVEILSAILIFFVVYHFGLSWKMLAMAILTWSLIVLSFIDLNKQILPDIITLSVLWLGLLLSLFYLFTTPEQAILGCLFGYGLLWITGTLYKIIRKKEGIGHGDYKMLAMLGAWTNVDGVLNILFLAVLSGLIISIILLILKKISAKNPIPFGPFIGIAGWVSVLTGPTIIHLIVPHMA